MASQRKAIQCVKHRQEGGKMPKRHLWMIVIFLCSLFMFAGYQDSIAAVKALPFQLGERMVYRAMWGGIPAGEAVIEVLPAVAVDGARTHHFAMTMTTNSQVEMFYKLRERQDSYTDIPLTRTLQYRKKSTGNHPRDVVVLFDWKNRTATYASFGNAEKPVEILPGSVDPLALFFVIRAHRLKLGDVIEIPITDGRLALTLLAV